jgi:hypothetical protein
MVVHVMLKEEIKQKVEEAAGKLKELINSGWIKRGFICIKTMQPVGKHNRILTCLKI